MFSKALFKQSSKANGVMWTIITIAVCVMLAVLMMISGGGNLGEMRVGITNTMVIDSIDSETEKRGVNYYNILDEGLADDPSEYDQALNIAQLFSYANTLCENLGYTEGTEEYYEIFALIFSNLPKEKMEELIPFAGLVGIELTEEMIDALIVDVGLDYNYLNYSEQNPNMTRRDYIRNYAASFLSTNMVSERGVNKALAGLSSYGFDAEDYAALTYTNALGEEVSRYTGESGKVFLNKLATDSIVTYLARLDYELGLLDPNSPTIDADKERVKEELLASVGESFLASLPEKVGESLEELGTMDLFNLITGSIFYKVAGLLLPIIYIIMVANNLIAGQVDSGSMAYVLSTSTKRKQVVYTQATYLVGSLFAMCLCTTAVSFICFAFLDKSMISMTFGDLALLNLGFFVTLFALSGISFLTSCIFNRTKHSMGIGGGINMFFLVATILGLFGSKVLPNVVRIDSLNFFNYLSVITLFDEMSILGGTTTFIWKFAILIVVGVLCYIIGAERFKKKDLPL